MYKAICMPCGTKLNIEAVITILKAHADTVKHKTNVENFKTQTTFLPSSKDGKILIGAPTKPMKKLTTQQILTAEII